MKIKQLYLWQMINIKKSLYIFYTIIYGIYLISVLIEKLNSDINITGMGISSSIFVFITCLVFFGETFKFALCNGVSRKTILVTQVGTMFSLSLTMTIIDTLNTWLFSFVINTENSVIFKSIYENQSLFSRIFWTFGIYLLFGTIGYFIATLNSRLSKFMKLVVYIPIPVLLIVGLPLSISVLSASAKESLSKFVGKIISYLTASPYNMLLVAIIISIVFYLFSILLVRKAPLKTA